MTRLEPRGRLGHGSAHEFERAIITALLSTSRVLVHLDALEIDHPSKVLVFPAALVEAGGWPRVHLVLCGGSPETVQALTFLGATRTVPHARSETEAEELFSVRPPLVRRRVFFELQPVAATLARGLVEDACASWHLPDSTAYWAQLIISEFVTNAVQHARTSCHVVVEFTGTALRLSVHDGSDQPPVEQPVDVGSEHGRGLQLVSALSDRWGVRQGSGDKVTWAVMAATELHDDPVPAGHGPQG